APFIRAMIAKTNRSEEFKALWNDSRLNIAPLVMLVAARVLIALAMVVYVIGHLFGYSMSFSIAVGLVLIFAMYSSKKLQERSIQLEKTFFNNLHSRERYAEAMGQKKGSYLTQLMSDELHLASVSLPENSCWEGMTLKELDLGNKFNISVASVIRGSIRINIPVALTRLYPHDKLEVIGTDEQLTKFIEAMNADVFENEEFDIDDREMKLVEFVITAESVFAGKSISQSGIKAKYHCLIVGIEVDGQIQMPNRDTVLSEGSVVWAVGENADVERLPDLRA
ncbi:MAG: TrkA C-terminal domain-containing protein, partial [Bacteroidaceae bacterium]|nr:TrkA C-terminal domain-containing protein [Bacteroidaceae bacterium]